jgi:hypothetical protein
LLNLRNTLNIPNILNTLNILNILKRVRLAVKRNNTTILADNILNIPKAVVAVIDKGTYNTIHEAA